MLGGTSDAGFGARSVYFDLSVLVRDAGSRASTKQPVWPPARASVCLLCEALEAADWL